MNKKIIIGCIGVVFLFLTISVVSANVFEKTSSRRESPLFNVKTKYAIDDKIDEIFEGFRSNYINRCFLNFRNSDHTNANYKFIEYNKWPPSIVCTEITGQTCGHTHCIFC